MIMRFNFNAFSLKMVRLVLWMCASMATAEPLLGSAFDYQISIDPPQPRVGEPFTLKIALKSDDAGSISLDPNYLADDGTTWVRVTRPEKSLSGFEGKQKVFAVELVGLFRGAQPLPPIKVFRKGQEMGTLALGHIELMSHLTASDETTLPTELTLSPAEARIVEHPLIQHKSRILWGLASLLALGLAFLAWTLVRRKLAAALPPLAPDARALALLDQLAAERLIERRQIKEFYSRLSDTVRDYLGSLFGIDALEMTTSELLQALEGQPMSLEVRQEIEAVLEEADLVKFARYRPPASICERALQRAREIIRRLPPPRPDNESALGAGRGAQ